MEITEWDYHIGDLVDIAEQFINESALSVTFNRRNSTEYFWNIITDPNSTMFAEKVNDKVAAVVIVNKAKECYNEPFGYIVKLYVAPQARGTGVSRKLMQAACDWFDSNGCVHSFVSATAAIGQDAAFVNLCSKFNYKPAGEILARSIGIINE